MILDLDSKLKNLQDTHKDIIEVTKIKPNWLIETGGGYQFGWVLKNHVFMDSPGSVRYLRAIKKEIVKRFSLDANASMRNKHFFWNPLAATNYIFDGGFDVDLDDFKHLLPEFIKYTKQSKRINIVSSSSKNYIPGNRHHFMCIRVLEIAQRYNVRNERILIGETIKFHDNLDTKVNKLENDVIVDIAVWGYNIFKNKGIDSNIGKVSQVVTPRKLKSIFEEYGRHLEPDEFKAAVSKRQRESAITTNKIRPKNHLDKLLIKRQKSAIKKIKRIENWMIKNSIKITQTSLVKISKQRLEKGISVKSVKRYLAIK
jgi:uncharacterized protein YkvS